MSKTAKLSPGDGCALLITSSGPGDYSVWVSLPHHDPVQDIYGFIIGVGESRDDAVADAVKELEGLVARLQGPPGDILERME